MSRGPWIVVVRLRCSGSGHSSIASSLRLASTETPGRGFIETERHSPRCSLSISCTSRYVPMKFVVGFFLSVGLSLLAGATEFKLGSFNRYGAAPSLELFMYPGDGESLGDIFRVLEFTRESLYVRLIGGSSEETNRELLEYYDDRFPYWKGDLTKEPDMVKPLFVEALMSTTLFRELESKLKDSGYSVRNVSFEKLVYDASDISVPDVYITCERTAPEEAGRYGSELE